MPVLNLQLFDTAGHAHPLLHRALHGTPLHFCHFHVQMRFYFMDLHLQVKSPKQQCLLSQNVCALQYLHPIWWSYLWSHLEVHAINVQTNRLCSIYWLKEWPLCRQKTYQRPWVNDVILQYGHSTNFIGLVNLGMINYSVANNSKL
jgi:hypothetical protein